MATGESLSGKAAQSEKRPPIVMANRVTAAQSRSVAGPNAQAGRRAVAPKTAAGTATNQVKTTKTIVGASPPGSQVSKAKIDKAASKARQTAVDEAKILEWLAGDQSNVDCKNVAAATPSTASVPKRISDNEILRSVGNRLAERGILSFTRIGLDSKSGVITVRGEVTSEAERRLLLQILRSTPGVQTVQDGLSIVRSKATKNKSPRLFESASDLREMLSRIQGALAEINLVPASVALIVIGFVFFCLWSQGPARPFAVYPVKGRVLLDDQPIPKATIVLHPLDQRMKSKFPSGLLPRATAHDDGRFTVGTFEPADGAPAGEFVATVLLIESVRDGNEWVHGPNLLPAAYASPESSPFKVKITRETKEISLLVLHKNDGSIAANH